MEESSPLISVVMPCYNGGKYLKDAIDSILNQTFTDFEFIIIDGFSNDSTDEIINSYSDKRILLYKREKRGIGDALKYGCSLARGKFIARMDCDDVSMPSRFEEELKKFRDHQDAVLVSCTCWFMDYKSDLIRPSFLTTSRFLIKHDLESICHPGVMMLKSAYMQTGGYANLAGGEDNFLWRRLAPYGSFYIIKEPLLKYRLLPNSLNKILDESYVKNDLLIKLEKLSKKKEYEEKDVEQINEDIRNHIIPKELNAEIRYTFKGNLLRKIYFILCKNTNQKIALYSLSYMRNVGCLIRIIYRKSIKRIS